jgi:hypothetical protein
MALRGLLCPHFIRKKICHYFTSVQLKSKTLGMVVTKFNAKLMRWFSNTYYEKQKFRTQIP